MFYTRITTGDLYLSVQWAIPELQLGTYFSLCNGLYQKYIWELFLPVQWVIPELQLGTYFSLYNGLYQNYNWGLTSLCAMGYTRITTRELFLFVMDYTRIITKELLLPVQWAIPNYN